MRRFLGALASCAIVTLAALHGVPAMAAAGNVTTFAGGGTGTPPASAILATLDDPRALAVDATGATFYFNSGASVRKVTGGLIATVVENAGRVDSLVADAAGNLFYSDSQAHQVKRIDPSGVISIVAGTGVPGFAGDGGPATAAQLDRPGAIALLGTDLLVADINNRRVRRISGGIITTVAGNGTLGEGGDGGPALQAQIRHIGGIVADGAGGFFFVQGVGDSPTGGVVDPGRLRHVDSGGTISLFAIVGVSFYPGSLARDSAGNVYAAGGISVANFVARISPDGAVSRIAGTGMYGFGGDQGPAVSAYLASPTAVALSPSGELCIADSGNNRIRKVDTAGVIRTAAGGGGVGADSRIQAPGDGGPPEQAVLKSPDGVAIRFGSVLISDPADHRVREVSGGSIVTRAGTGSAGAPITFNGVSSTLNAFTEPHAAVYDQYGAVVAAATGNSQVLLLNHCCVQNSLTFGAGATSIALNAAGDAYVVTPSNHQVYKIGRNSLVGNSPDPWTLVAGSGSPTHGGDGGPAIDAGLSPGYVAFDAAGNLYISDATAHRVRKVDASGMISTVAGNGTRGSAGDGGLATAASLDTPAGIAVADDTLYIAEAGSNRIRVVRPDGVIEALAGSGVPGFAGDGGPAANAQFDGLRGMAWDEATSSLLVSDSGNHRVRRVEIIDTIPTAFSLGAVLDVAQSTLVQSPPVTPGGYNRPAAISVTGGEYSIGCTATFTATAATLEPGQSVCVRHLSASFAGTEAQSVLTVGGVSAPFISRTAYAGSLQVSPASIAFAPGGPNTAQPVTVANDGTLPVRVTAVAVTGQFSVSHDCAQLAPAATCTLQVTHVPTSGGIHVGRVRISATSAEVDYVVPLSGGTPATTGELITSYYEAILRRAPDPAGLAFWQGEVARMASIGASTNEAFYSMAMYFFSSPEYASFARDDGGFVTDLYNAFFQRAPDAMGLDFWVSQLAAGMPREIVLASFLFSSEFTEFMALNTGAAPARSEIDMVMDFYRGLLGRLPDPGGFAFWLGKMRTAQCDLTAPAANIRAQADLMSAGFLFSDEYRLRNRTDPQFVGDLYNAFLRRGGDLAGVQFWINRLVSVARDTLRRDFLDSPEFDGRIAAVIAQGCLP